MLEGPLNSSSKIVEEINEILVTEKNKDEDCISLFEIAILLRNLNYKYYQIKSSYGEYCKNLIQSRCGSSSSLVIYDFDYDKKELSIGFSWSRGHYDEINFSKKDSDLYISKSESIWSNEVFAILHPVLSKLYDDFMSLSSYKKESRYGIRAVNSNFLVNISPYGIDIFDTNRLMKKFQLSYKSYSNSYECDCNSNMVINALQGKKNYIFQNVFVKISDCPEWSQSILSSIRLSKLAQEDAFISEQIDRENRRQKRLDLIKKIFPFLKK